ncbi:MAG: hypothetical protein GX882_00515 [Methanomicrobiales archaeon]|nr:hypothetical protein [Methanomicrobiales archaeon]
MRKGDFGWSRLIMDRAPAANAMPIERAMTFFSADAMMNGCDPGFMSFMERIPILFSSLPSLFVNYHLLSSGGLLGPRSRRSTDDRGPPSRLNRR